jgi:exodeoxyribonuclease V alpha subunit
LLAPTGSASLRLSETTHQEASTIHLKCLRDRTINTDVLICDETSMVDLDVFAMMLGCIDNPKIRIVLIGDKFQLASVSYGTVFADLISSDVIPTTSLTKVFRYGNSGIAYAGANTRQGKDFFNDDVVKNKNDHLNIINDWDFYERDTDEEITSTVVDLYGKLRKKGIKKNDILILSAYNKGDCGTYVINNLIQSAWNPPKANEKIFERKVPHFGKITFRVGDRVINTKNNYSALTYDAWNEIQESDGTLTEDDMEKTVIYNGQRGDVVEIRDDIMIVKFDEQLIVFDKLLVYNLLLAYSISCHKSQGNEIPYVINVVSPSHNRLMTKNLMYVANTRAKKHHINVGSINAYKDALKVDDVLRRNTWLLDLLKENA